MSPVFLAYFCIAPLSENCKKSRSSRTVQRMHGKTVKIHQNARDASVTNVTAILSNANKNRLSNIIDVRSNECAMNTLPFQQECILKVIDGSTWHFYPVSPICATWGKGQLRLKAIARRLCCSGW